MHLCYFILMKSFGLHLNISFQVKKRLQGVLSNALGELFYTRKKKLAKTMYSNYGQCHSSIVKALA